MFTVVQKWLKAESVTDRAVPNHSLLSVGPFCPPLSLRATSSTQISRVAIKTHAHFIIYSNLQPFRWASVGLLRLEMLY